MAFKTKINNKPTLIDLPEEKLNEIKDRLSLVPTLLEEDKNIILNILTVYAWLQKQLKHTKLTIHRLKNMFGFNSEKRKNAKPENTGFGPDFLTKGVSAKEALSLENTPQALEKEALLEKK